MREIKRRLQDYRGVYGDFIGIIGDILGLYRDNGQETETTIMGYIGIIGYIGPHQTLQATVL